MSVIPGRLSEAKEGKGTQGLPDSSREVSSLLLLDPLPSAFGLAGGDTGGIGDGGTCLDGTA